MNAANAIAAHSNPDNDEGTGEQLVCYRCHYVGLGGSHGGHLGSGGELDAAASSKFAAGCPLCGFALITEARGIPAAISCDENVFSIVERREDAPPLPGVSSVPRKAQLLAEAREQRARRGRVNPRRYERLGTGTALPARAFRVSVAFALSGAAAAGLLLAMAMRGGF